MQTTDFEKLFDNLKFASGDCIAAAYNLLDAIRIKYENVLPEELQMLVKGWEMMARAYKKSIEEAINYILVANSKLEDK